MSSEYYPFSHETCHHFYDNGGCIFCGYHKQKRSASEKPVSIGEQIKHFNFFAKENFQHIKKSGRLIIAPNGSWFVQVPKELRENIYDFANKNELELKYETRASLFNPEKAGKELEAGKLEQLTQSLTEIKKNHTVSFGLEVADDSDLITLNKSCCLDDYILASGYVHDKKAKVCANILLQPPRISEPIKKAFQTAEFAAEEMQAQEFLIMPCIPMKDTLAYQDWIQGKWNPISATAASEIFRLIKTEYPEIKTRYLDLRVYRFHGRHGRFKRKPGKWSEEEKSKEREKVRKIAKRVFTVSYIPFSTIHTYHHHESY